MIYLQSYMSLLLASRLVVLFWIHIGEKTNPFFISTFNEPFSIAKLIFVESFGFVLFVCPVIAFHPITKISPIPICRLNFFQNTPPSNTLSLDPPKSLPYFSLSSILVLTRTIWRLSVMQLWLAWVWSLLMLSSVLSLMELWYCYYIYHDDYLLRNSPGLSTRDWLRWVQQVIRFPWWKGISTETDSGYAGS